MVCHENGMDEAAWASTRNNSWGWIKHYQRSIANWSNCNHRVSLCTNLIEGMEMFTQKIEYKISFSVYSHTTSCLMLQYWAEVELETSTMVILGNFLLYKEHIQWILNKPTWSWSWICGLILLIRLLSGL